MIAKNTDPYVFPKHFYIDNVEIKEVGASTSCDVAYTLEYAADYYPYGKILREYNPQAEKYLTTHHERDTETGLDYRGARYYDSDIARFLSLDENAESYAEWTPYVYVGDNPVKYIDPDGKDWLDAVVGTLVGAATNVVPGTTALRNFYKPNDASTYNNTLRNTDNAFTVLGVGLTVGGTDVAAAGGTATVTVVGAPVGVPAAGIGIAVAGTGALMTVNATINKANGYNYDGSGNEKQGSGNGKGKNNRKPDSKATGDHSTINESGNTTYKKNDKNPTGFDEVKRVDTKGSAHKNPDGTSVETPHVHEKGSKVVTKAKKVQIIK